MVDPIDLIAGGGRRDGRRSQENLRRSAAGSTVWNDPLARSSRVDQVDRDAQTATNLLECVARRWQKNVGVAPGEAVSRAASAWLKIR